MHGAGQLPGGRELQGVMQIITNHDFDSTHHATAEACYPKPVLKSERESYIRHQQYKLLYLKRITKRTSRRRRKKRTQTHHFETKLGNERTDIWHVLASVWVQSEEALVQTLQQQMYGLIWVKTLALKWMQGHHCCRFNPPWNIAWTLPSQNNFFLTLPLLAECCISGDLRQSWQRYTVWGGPTLGQFIIKLLFLVGTCGALKGHFPVRLRRPVLILLALLNGSRFWEGMDSADISLSHRAITRSRSNTHSHTHTVLI